MTEPARHPLRGLLICQFLGAFNDNAWKFIVTLLAIAVAAEGLEDIAREEAVQYETTLAFVIFTLPLMLFSLPAGVLADRFSKRSVILAMKALEVVLMAAGTLALLIAPENTTVLLAILCLMGVQSALFSPAKYGILPEILPHERLSAGNGALEMWTFFAIILGTAAGGPLLERTRLLNGDGSASWLAGLLLTLLAVVGLVAARGVPKVAPARSDGRFVETTIGAWRAIRDERVLWLTILGMTFYWATASLVGQELIVYTKIVLKERDSLTALPMAAFAIGVGAGSVWAGRLSASNVETGLIPLGAAGLAVPIFLIGALARLGSPPSFGLTLALMLPAGVASGFLLVPLSALLQWRAPPDRRGAVIALGNVLVFGGMLAGSLGALGLVRLGVPVADSFLGAGILTVLGTLWALWLVPHAFLRLMLVMLTHTIYRLNVIGRRNVPEKGGALLVPNHVSFADGLFLLASVDRPIRFLVDSIYFHHPLLKPFMKSLGAIPISTSGGPRTVLRALRDAGKHLDEGHLVCIFAEGQITRTGMMQPFRRGLERIVKGRSAPIIPVHLDGVWGSIFSHAGGRFVTKLPHRVPYPVTVTFGEPLPAGTSVHEVRTSVHELAEVAWTARTSERSPLHRTFISRVRRHPFRLIFADESRPRVSRLQSLIGSIALARQLRREWAGQENVGILLPSTVAAAMTNIAAALAGRTAVNLNFTVGPASMESAVTQAALQTIVTNRLFLKKAGIELPGNARIIWIEEVAKRIGVVEKAISALLALLAPKRLIELACGAARKTRVEDVVTIIFSSGSTGEPKGVMLTHANVDANVEGVAQVMRVDAQDRLLGILPLFHSFGYMALWFACNRDLGTVFHPNPLDAGQIGELVQRYNITLMIATPTFLQLYLRRCTPAQFGSLRVVLVGAEKLTNRLALAFEERFGIRPLEGYGTTECAPAITVSSLDYRAPGFYQPGSRRGSVGQPLPGVALRVVDPDTGESLRVNEPGLILVKGPNVMQGYLGQHELTAEVMRDGWYVTGDIGAIDEDGFLRITDRLSRFAKIGGEMVPHGKVEEALQKVAEEDVQVFAVTSVPDEKKGERLAVVHTLDEERIPEIVEKLAGEGLPNLFIPRADQFLKVDALPVLGTGKVNLRAVRDLAMEAFAPSHTKS